MRFLVAIFIAAVVMAAAANTGVDIWDGRIGHQDPALRAIHYDTTYDLSAQRRLPLD